MPPRKSLTRPVGLGAESCGARIAPPISEIGHPERSMNESLPIIDASETDERALAAEIGRAARGVGFFYLKGHGIDPVLIASVFAGAARFFALPTEVKERQSIRRSPHNRGYVALKGESLDPARAADLKEAYNIGLDLAADDPRVVRGEPFRGLNLWPDLPGWRARPCSPISMPSGRSAVGSIAASPSTSASIAISSRTSSFSRWRSSACCTIRRSP
jgi:hypothetical protein